MSQLKHLLDFVEIEIVDFDTTLSDRNNVSNSSLLLCKVFDDTYITDKEIYYANIQMKLFFIS